MLAFMGQSSESLPDVGESFPVYAVYSASRTDRG